MPQARHGATVGPSVVTDPRFVVRFQPPSQAHLGPGEHVPRPVADTEFLAARLAEMHTRPFFPSEARSLLRDAGFEVEEKSSLYISSDTNGRRVVFPARNIQLRYVN